MKIVKVRNQREWLTLDPKARAAAMTKARELQALGADFATAERNESKDKRGFVYVIRNPAWPEFCKVGRAFDPESRLSNFQTTSPLRDYELHYAAYFEDCYAAEKFIHETLADYRAEGEWFRLLPSVAEEHIESLGGYL